VIRAAISEAVVSGARLDAACRMVGLSARSMQRWQRNPDGEDSRRGPLQRPTNALTTVEEAQVLALMASRAYAGMSPKQLVPQLADEGLYLASESTMYRLQRRHGLRAQKRSIERTHITRADMVHRATGPNQVWSWDITWLPTLVRGRFWYLYLVLDVWSRRIVGWTVAERESGDIAAQLITRICAEEGVDPNGLVLHADNGKPMRGNTMVSTLQGLGIVPSFSRPHVSNDNPYSEGLFRTLKYTPAYPRLPFVTLEAAERWVARFVAWYNGEHRHSGIRFVTPDQRHFGQEYDVLSQRRELYAAARRSNPERWTRSARNWSPVELVVLNPQPEPVVT
jgi:transposase InsO family protein